MLAAVPGIGAELCALVAGTATGTSPRDTDDTIAQRWLAVQALGSACANPKQLQSTTRQALTAAQAVADGPVQLVLLGQCWRAVAACAATMPAADLRALDAQAVQCAGAHPRAAPLVAGVAAYVTARGAGAFSPDTLEVHLCRCTPTDSILHTVDTRRLCRTRTHHMQALLPALQGSLASPDASLRAAALELLCALPQPPTPTPPEAEAAPAPCTVLQALRSANLAARSLEGGRAAVLALGQVQHALEYARVASVLYDAVVLGLLGSLHIRYESFFLLLHACIGCTSNAAGMPWCGRLRRRR